jgi:hypothetical protein
MKTLRNLTVSFLLVLAAIGFNPVVNRAMADEPEPPGPGCLWAGSTYMGNGCWSGAYSCSWESQHCDYLFEYCNGSWSQVGDPSCTPREV